MDRRLTHSAWTAEIVETLVGRQQQSALGQERERPGVDGIAIHPTEGNGHTVDIKLLKPRMKRIV